MKKRSQLDLMPFMRQLGYTFSNIELLQQALTHRSMAEKNNERLEFLGDSILNFVIAEALYVRAAHANEGALTRFRANLVNGDTLALIARELDLGDYLRLGSGELKSGGTERDSILADALEAVIAAMYQDCQDLFICRDVILAWYGDKVEAVLHKKLEKDPKTKLQEYLQQKGYALPVYEVITITGQAHAQTFTIRCRIAALDKETIATGTNRRRAEQLAADRMLNDLGQ